MTAQAFDCQKKFTTGFHLYAIAPGWVARSPRGILSTIHVGRRDDSDSATQRQYPRGDALTLRAPAR